MASAGAMMAADPRESDGSAALTQAAPRNRSYTCCNTRIDAITFDDAVSILCSPSDEERAVHLCNAGTLALTTRDRAFADCITRGDLNLPDGMPLVWIARRLGIPLPGRVYGPDLMGATLDRGRQVGLRHYFYGSTQEVVNRLTAQIEHRWPGTEIVGVESPPFRPLTAEEESDLVARIRSTGPDVVWVGLGTPKQDLFIDHFRDRLGTTLVSVGAAFDFHAGTVSQAPTWMQDRGLEWAYRLAKEPRRLWRRYLIGNSVFLAGVAGERPRRLHTRGGTPRGVVLIVGPDGTGKTALADGIAERAAADGTRVRRAHWRPGIVLGRSSDGVPVTEPHAEPPRGVVTSIVKVGLSLADVWLAFAGPWRRDRRGGLVLWERGWHDQLVDPVRYRLHPAVAPVASLAARLVPRADVVILAEGDSEVIHARKPELDPTEIDNQARRWRAVADQAARRVVPVDTVRNNPGQAAAIAYEAVRHRVTAGGPTDLRSDRQECRPADRTWRSLPLTPPRLALVASGGREALPGLAVLYRPLRARGRAGLLVGRSLFGVGAAPLGDPPQLDVPGLLGDLAPGSAGWVVMRSSAPGRLVVGAARRGRVILIAKVGREDDADLANEAEVLLSLASQSLAIMFPRMRWSGLRDGWRVLALEPLPTPTGRVSNEDVLGICTYLAGTVGGLVHGDLAPWNMFRCGKRVALLDWEAARTGHEPLFDLAHFVIQRGALLGRYSPAEAVHALTAPGSLGMRYLTAVGEDPYRASAMVRGYLDAAPGSGDLRVARYRVAVRRELLG